MKKSPRRPTCLDCGSEELLGEVTLVRYLPLSSRGDSIRVTSKEAKITSVDLKLSWEREGNDVKEVRGPILCYDCGAIHEYHMGRDGGLRLRSTYDDAED